MDAIPRLSGTDRILLTPLVISYYENIKHNLKKRKIYETIEALH